MNLTPSLFFISCTLLCYPGNSNAYIFKGANGNRLLPLLQKHRLQTGYSVADKAKTENVRQHSRPYITLLS
jgi:hypothetical protein